MDVCERLTEILRDALGEGAVGGSTDDFHGKKESDRRGAARIVDSGWAVGNTLLVIRPPSHFP